MEIRNDNQETRTFKQEPINLLFVIWKRQESMIKEVVTIALSRDNMKWKLYLT